MSSFRLPLVASILGHAGVLALLVLFAAQLPPVPLPEPRKSGIEVMLAPPQPAAETPPPTPEPPPVAETEPPPPEPPPPPVVIPKPEPPPPPPPPKPVVHKPVVKPPPPRPQPVREMPPQPQLPLPRAMPQPAPMQTAAVPVPAAPHPAPLVSGNYRAALSAWLESHKRYPDGARSRGEEGRAVLRFRVDRSGRVLNYAVVSSTGYADLDAAIDAMMRGATLPAFPADMTASDVEVSVTVRFALTH